MTILIFGQTGKISRAFQKVLFNRKDVVFIGKKECNFLYQAQIEQVLRKYKPTILINTVAYTRVDQAQVEPEIAFLINTKALEVIAKYMARKNGSLLIHYSTNYVFSGSKNTPYSERDSLGPIEKLSIYGQTKLLCEKNIFKIYKQYKQKTQAVYYILRTSWVYGDGPNFIKTILSLGLKEKILTVVDDQISTPTSSIFLAKISIILLEEHIKNFEKSRCNIYHVVPHGYTSQYYFARLIFSCAKINHVPLKISLQNIMPVSMKNYPFTAPRPKNSCLDNSKLCIYLNTIHSQIKLENWEKEALSFIKTLVKDYYT